MKYIIKPVYRSYILEDSKHNKLSHGFGLAKNRKSNQHGIKQDLGKELNDILDLIGFDEAKNLVIHHRDTFHSNNSPSNLYLITKQRHDDIHNLAFDNMFNGLSDQCPNISEDDLLNLIYRYGDFIKYIKNNPFLDYFGDLKDTLNKTIFKGYIRAINKIKNLDSQYPSFVREATDSFEYDNVKDFYTLVNTQLSGNENYKFEDIVNAYNEYKNLNDIE